MKRIAVVAIAVLAFSAGIHTGRWVESNKTPPVVKVTVNPVSTVDPIYNCTITTHDDNLTHYTSREEFTLTATQIINMNRGDKVGKNHEVTVPLWNTSDHNVMMGLISTENSSFNCVLEKK